MRYVLFALPLLAACQAAVPLESDCEPSESGLPSIAEATAGADEVAGFVPCWWNADEGELRLELPPAGTRLLYWVALPHGLGSNDVGLDRGQLGGQWLLEVRRVGHRVLLVAPNLDWRSGSADSDVRRAVSESFAESVVFGFELLAESDDGLLVDATDFLLRDAHRVAAGLARAGQGSFSLDRSRSVILGEEVRGFPDNSQVEALLTFVCEDPGGEVTATAADARSVSLRVRHNFVRLPEPGFRPRVFHPRSGFGEFGWTDTSAALDEPTAVRYVLRHRLEKRDPSLASSPPVEPIVYYVDRGAPEPVRTALLEGARYWEPVFERAGFPGGFRAELLPEGADPHDVRYNVVQWVNRSTRGWSYGNTVTDPRTGEILKGHVTLGALRVRQDVRIADGLLAPYADGDGKRSIEMALARIRQLAAHEIGHTLGLAHNFAASANGRASVMDYPAPVVERTGSGGLDLSGAYRDGCGEWDELAIRYGYSDFRYLPGGEEQGLREVLEEAEHRGLRFLTDRDARGPDRAHPLANLWDNGSDPVEYLEHELTVRRLALVQFGEGALREGRPLAELEEVLIPVYLHHRYQLEAAVRSVGGVDYDYELVGDGAPSGTAPVDAPRQRRALELALETLRPEFLELPASIRSLVPPRPPGSRSYRELQDPGALLFDPVDLAAGSIELTLDLLLDPVRAARLAEQARRDPRQLSWEDVVAAVVERTSERSPAPPGDVSSIREALRTAVVGHLMRLAADAELPARVREPANRALHAMADADEEGSLERDLLLRFFEDPRSESLIPEPARIPPGSPIGCGFGG